MGTPEIKTKTTGLKRFWYASKYSCWGLKAAFLNEPAFRYELFIVLPLLPIAFWAGDTPLEVGILIASLLLVLAMELVNSAIEAVVDRTGREHHELSGLAKDLGSAVVFVTIGIALVLWTAVLI